MSPSIVNDMDIKNPYLTFTACYTQDLLISIHCIVLPQNLSICANHTTLSLIKAKKQLRLLDLKFSKDPKLKDYNQALVEMVASVVHEVVQNRDLRDEGVLASPQTTDM